MLHLITGTPGAGKTLYAVFLIDNYEKANQRALEYNATALKKNNEEIEKNNLADYFLSHTYFSKKTKENETLIFEPDYFNYLGSKQRTEGMFLDIQHYNGILKVIKNDLNLDLKPLKDVRHIYANIDGLKVDNVRPVEIDWRKCPDGSIIFYDEIQLIFEYSTDNKQDKEDIVKELTIHRHRAFDIYGITQFPSLVHTNYRAVVGLHYHLHRGWGAPSATVYVWANCRDKPNSLGNKLTAERDFRFNYPKRLYEIYESATANTVKLRIPLKLFAILLIPLVGLVMVGNMIFGGERTFFGTIFGSSEKKEVKKETSTTDKANVQASDPNALSQFNPDIECRKAVNVEKPQCVQWFNDLSKTKASIDSQGSITTVAYNPDKPYDFAPEQQIQIRDYPRLTGCAKKPTGELVGIDQQGNVMPKISKKDCQRWLGGERPFDYTRSPVQVQNNANSNYQVNTSDNIQQAAQRHISQEIEQANNYVEPQLQAKTITGANAL
ncbi:zonular occludens toxin domain-containing protein [Acinetobacter sp. WCHAc060025]|uniref:zonular occludens toxin domain-containing protein n=1 Tax=Acinetobacter sp. WCHAc060025 TaxID=2518625 RepID=UPI00102336D2|nr:zonular occludens toxin domain-containing protein [Acinetobacter sp. WCHAc060025]RZG71453.1 zonula occludens toxin [Acinetobacter sp. WCHAc060025]